MGSVSFRGGERTECLPLPSPCLPSAVGSWPSTGQDENSGERALGLSTPRAKTQYTQGDKGALALPFNSHPPIPRWCHFKNVM